MSVTVKVKNKAEELTGKAKQGIGDATDNERLAAEGQAQQTSAHAKQAGIEAVMFDRGGYKYHGRVQALAEGAREGGLQF